ncbi:MAG: S-methyl-5-thioribose-1-phosphate isomerase [Dehalococcoidia bacterium]|nr:S-methyl-5-thioribose-1-phosphate isomerase [Dehalococcoidia bacterium]
MAEVKAIEWANGKLRLLDQTKLPVEQTPLELDHYKEVVKAIAEMRVRGAPAIGVAAAYAVAMSARDVQAESHREFLAQLAELGDEIASARPTAVNITWAVQRMIDAAESEPDLDLIRTRLLAEAQRIQEEDVEINRRMGKYGVELMPDGGAVLTHCNTGALATAGYGTALGVIRAGWETGKRFHVFNTETRPFLQGARLTSWELVQLGIPSTLIVDSSAGLLMRRGEVSCAIVGADRIAANGDVANKIGTYSLAVIARENGIPFYVAAPTSTVDLSIPSGNEIPIEERQAEEVTRFGGAQTAPEGIDVRNPAFDITPHQYITAIVTEKGVVREPYTESLPETVKGMQVES